MLAVRIFRLPPASASRQVLRHFSSTPSPRLIFRGLRQPNQLRPHISHRHPSTLPKWRTSSFRNLHRQTQRRLNNPNLPKTVVPEAALSWSQRFRKLSREYGWAAAGVYFALSVADFPFCFLAVRMLGTDRIGRWEHILVGTVRDTVGSVFPGLLSEKVNMEVAGAGKEGAGEVYPKPGQTEVQPEWSWGVEEAQEANKSEATIWTQLALAYAIHKSFIFVRLPLTVAVTPKVVKTLRGWGWNIGKRRPKKPKANTPQP